jgi:serine/threonine-protein kinase HipA
MARTATVWMHKKQVGTLTELDEGKSYRFAYEPQYLGEPISATMPVKTQTFTFTHFPPFFEGVLPEGVMLDNLLRTYKLDKNDFLGQLLVLGGDLPGAVEVYPDTV